MESNQLSQNTKFYEIHSKSVLKLDKGSGAHNNPFLFSFHNISYYRIWQLVHILYITDKSII